MKITYILNTIDNIILCDHCRYFYDNLRERELALSELSVKKRGLGCV